MHVAIIKGLIILVPSYTMALLTGQMVYVLPMVVVTGIIAMAIRGKIADWIITDNEFKSDIQAVSTFLFSKDNGTNDRLKYQTGILKGPICIDNMTGGSSVGDQFVARALALLNDVLTVKRVNTINRYLNSDENEYRVDMDEMQ